MKEIEKTFQNDIELLITRFRLEDKSFNDIGVLFGVHEDTVRKWARRLGINIKVEKIAWNKGKKLSKETCLKMSLSRTGEKHPMWGKHHSEETKQKISENHKRPWLGRHHTIEAIEKCRIARLGKHHTEESKKKISEHNARPMLGKKPWNTGKTGVFHHSEETKNKMMGPKSDEHKEKISKARMGMKFSEEHKQHIREVQLNRSDEITRKCLMRRVPSSLEKIFLDIVDKLHLPYRFVGNGDFIIERKNPDFINMNGEKILIEVYCTKHKERFRDSGVEGWKQERKDVFGKYGWKIEFFNELQINEKEIKTRLG